jgi:hypothetical protein
MRRHCQGVGNEAVAASVSIADPPLDFYAFCIYSSRMQGEREHPRQHHRLALTTDVVLLTPVEQRLCALMLTRQQQPFAGAAVLPGGFVREDEAIDAAAARVLAEKVNLRQVFIEQLFTFGDVARDSRGRVVTVAHFALVPSTRLGAELPQGAQLAALEVPWHGLAGGDVRLRDLRGAELAVGFDHARILGTAVQRLRGKIDYAPVGFELLPQQFTLLDLQHVHEAVLGRQLNKDSFRRRMLASGLLAATGRRRTEVGHRPPELFRFRATGRRHIRA